MRVFISYAAEDRDKAEQVHLALTGAGYITFFDRASLPIAQAYHDRIRAAVQESDVFVFLASPDSTAPGSYALTELRYACSKWRHPGGHIVPVRIRDVPLKAIPIYLREVTILEPEGNLGAEVVSVVRELHYMLPGLAMNVSPKPYDGVSSTLLRANAPVGWIAWLFKPVPTLIVFWMQWVCAVFILYVDGNDWLGSLFGSLSLFWLLPMGFLISRFIARETNLARIVGGFVGGIVGASISQAIAEGGAVYGLVFGAFFGGFLSAYFTAPTRPIKLIWAFLSTVLLLAFMGVFKNIFSSGDWYSRPPGGALVGSALALGIGAAIAGWFYLLKTSQRNWPDKDRQVDDSEDDSSGPV